MASNKLRRLYFEERRLQRSWRVGFAALDAYHAALTRIKWDALESLGLVRISVEDDQDFRPDDGNCCCDDPQCSAKTGPAYGQVAQYRLTEDDRWENGDSIWGLTGYDDPAENCYTIDLMQGCLDAFRDAYQGSLRARSMIQPS
jgi:hypothetical protein